MKYRFPFLKLLVCFAIVIASSSNSSPTQADDGQAFFRFTGFGWGNGYHSYPPRCTNPQTVPPWIQCGPQCTDRYSLPNVGGCNVYGGGCQSGYGQGGYGRADLPSLNHVPLRYSPQPGASQPYAPQTESIESKSPLPAPMPQNGKSKEDKPVAPPENSGTTANPFGVSINYLSPQPRLQQNRPMNSLQNRIAYNSQRTSLNPSANKIGVAPNGIPIPNHPAFNRRPAPTPIPSNTFNGIR